MINQIKDKLSDLSEGDILNVILSSILGIIVSVIISFWIYSSN
jgi:hypothetical protein